MVIIETAHFQLFKLRDFITAFDHLNGKAPVTILINADEEGKVTLQLSHANDHTAISLPRKGDWFKK